MPRTIAGCVYRGYWRSVVELHAMTKISRTHLHRWHRAGTLTEAEIDGLLYVRELLEKAKQLGLTKNQRWRRVAKGWDVVRAYTTPLRLRGGLT
jgi:hypothetical protein